MTVTIYSGIHISANTHNSLHFVSYYMGNNQITLLKCLTEIL